MCKASVLLLFFFFFFFLVTLVCASRLFVFVLFTSMFVFLLYCIVYKQGRAVIVFYRKLQPQNMLHCSEMEAAFQFFLITLPFGALQQD